MATVLEPPSRPPKEGGAIPLLHTGDHMDRATFDALYEQMPEGFRAELVGGVVYVMSAVNVPHGELHSEVMLWLGGYKAVTPGVRLLDNTTVILGADAEPQPDACLFLSPERGGQAQVEDRRLIGAPELVVEVAYSSAAHDLHNKKRDYEKAGVREYVVAILQEPRVVWYVRRGEAFVELAPGEDGRFRSETFPGLCLDPETLLRLDTLAVREALEQGLAAPEHAAFVRRLAG